MTPAEREANGVDRPADRLEAALRKAFNELTSRCPARCGLMPPGIWVTEESSPYLCPTCGGRGYVDATATLARLLRATIEATIGSEGLARNREEWMDDAEAAAIRALVSLRAERPIDHAPTEGA